MLILICQKCIRDYIPGWGWWQPILSILLSDRQITNAALLYALHMERANKYGSMLVMCSPFGMSLLHANWNYSCICTIHCRPGGIPNSIVRHIVSRISKSWFDPMHITHDWRLVFQESCQKKSGATQNKSLMQLSLIGCAVSTAAVHDKRYTSCWYNSHHMHYFH